MRFLVITDLHQKTSALGWINAEIKEYSPDAVLFLGDITDFGTSEDAVGILESIDSEVYAIPGNCDPLDLPERIKGVCHSMHGECTEIGGMHLAAVGGSNPTIFDTPFELSEENLYSMLRPISKNRMILMTHAPAHGRLDTIPSGLNVGSTGIRRIVDEFSPVLALSGHIHEAIGAVRFGDTLFVNPGPARDGRSALVTLDGGAASAELLGPLSR